MNELTEEQWASYRKCKDYLETLGMNKLIVKWWGEGKKNVAWQRPIHVRMAYLESPHSQLIRLAYYSTEDMDRGCPSLECTQEWSTGEIEIDLNEPEWVSVEYPGEAADGFLQAVNKVFGSQYTYEMFDHMCGLEYLPQQEKDNGKT